MPDALLRPRGTTPTIELYLCEIRHDALLSSEEEGSLARAIERGDRDARARMIQANLRLVVKIARQFQGHGLSLEDLIGEGNLGLIRAATDFNPRFGTRFSTYAACWIKQAIRAALTNTTATIRLPAHMVGLLSRWRKTERVMRRDLGREPTFTEIADVLTLTLVQRELVTHALKTRHLLREGNRDQPSDMCWTCEDTTDTRESPERTCEALEEREALLRRLERLDERERMVVALRFGLGGARPLTLQQVGLRLGVTREWVRKIEMRAVRKLNDPESARVPRQLHRSRERNSRGGLPSSREQPVAQTA